MKKYIFRLAFILGTVVLSTTSPVFAQEVSEDAKAITSLLKNTWDKPDSALEVAPIVVTEDAAIAGWAQSGRGGRALLRKQHGQWRVLLCGGNNMKDVAVLHSAGIPHQTARSLADAVKRADEQVSPEKLKLLSSFEGLVHMDGAHHHGDHESHQHKH